MQMDSSASRTGSEPASACEWATTVRMPISRQVRRMRSAISPRLAMRILWNMVFSALLAALHEEERLAELDGLGVLDEDLQDAARHLGLDLVHELHRLDDAEGLPLLDRVALADEWCRLGARSAVEGADHGRLDGHRAGGGFGGALGAFRLGQRGGRGGGLRRDRGRVPPDDAHAETRALHLELRQVVRHREIDDLLRRPLLSRRGPRASCRPSA